MELTFPWLVYPVFLVISFLYGSVGLGGATGYLAVLTLFGITDPIIAPVVLALNIVVAGISFGHFFRAGHFRKELLIPFVIASIPASFVGGILPISRLVFVFILGITLFGAGVRLLFMPDVSGRSAPRRSGLLYWLFSLGLGVILGLLSGVTGSGGGFLLIPVLLLLYRARPKPTAAAAAGFVVLNSVAGISGHLWRGHMDWTMTLSLLSVVVVGGFAGSRLGSTYWDSATIQKVISVVLLAGGAKLLVDFTGLVL